MWDVSTAWNVATGTFGNSEMCEALSEGPEDVVHRTTTTAASDLFVATLFNL